MKYYGVVGTTLTATDESSSPVCPEGYIEMLEDRPSIEHLAQADGSWVKHEATPEQMQVALQKQLTDAVQCYMDAKAKERNYDNILTACTYATDPNPKFAAEGQACVEWRSKVWASCYTILAEVLAGEREIPTPEELLAELPQLVWPEIKNN